MIRFYFHPTPNPAKVALMLEETGLVYEVVPVDTSKGEQHTAEFRAINPNGKVPAIVDTEGPDGKEARVFDSTAILLYLGEKTGRLMGSPADKPELLSWLLFIATGIGPFSGQAVHFQHAAPEKLAYAINRYRREVERHYEVLDTHLKGCEFIVGKGFTIVDISAWGWLEPLACCRARSPLLLRSRISSVGTARSTRDRPLRGPARSEKITPSKRRSMTRRGARSSRPTTRRLLPAKTGAQSL
jgi:GST-like protein